MDHALVMYSHGLGDVIQLTPHLRYLYKHGYKVDLMCRPQVRQSKLLDACPYIANLIDIHNPWKVKDGLARNLELYEKLKNRYDWSGCALHHGIKGHKIDFTAEELNIPLTDKTLEVFITDEVEERAREFVHNKFPGGFIFVHTNPEEHKFHAWNPNTFIEENLPALPRLYNNMYWDINFAFAVVKRATHVVLSSSVFVHACDAMNKTMDVVNYGRPDRKVWPLNTSKVLRIRENGKWIKS